MMVDLWTYPKLFHRKTTDWGTHGQPNTAAVSVDLGVCLRVIHSDNCHFLHRIKFIKSCMHVVAV